MHLMSNITLQFINTWEKSHEPWDVKNSSPYFIYVIQQQKDLFIILRNYLVAKSFIIMNFLGIGMNV
ncbi:hypothetical protein TI10_06230 [Photorhabdus luminescens subsp. luminescens]|nr:hypothetical protein TI10_06230 [Photorhabdus luminescens subsp. luminescens]